MYIPLPDFVLDEALFAVAFVSVVDDCIYLTAEVTFFSLYVQSLPSENQLSSSLWSMICMLNCFSGYLDVGDAQFLQRS